MKERKGRREELGGRGEKKKDEVVKQKNRDGEKLGGEERCDGKKTDGK